MGAGLRAVVLVAGTACGLASGAAAQQAPAGSTPPPITTRTNCDNYPGLGGDAICRAKKIQLIESVSGSVERHNQCQKALIEYGKSAGVTALNSLGVDLERPCDAANRIPKP